MKGVSLCVSVGALALVLAAPATAQQPFFYPSQGQSQQKQNQDFGECHAWAVQQTGFDPMSAQATAPAPSTAPPPTERQQGGLLRGAAIGAGGGALGGAIAGDAGKGAAIGALAGGVIGGIRRRNQVDRQEQQRRAWEQQQRQQQAQHQSNLNAQRGNYNRALGACMQGRGYSVN